MTFQYAEADSLRILAFPCNQFGSQEPGTDAEVKAFAEAKGVDATKGFIMFSKIDVNGGNTHPLWTFLKDRKGGMLGNFIKWNFTKFVADKEGQPQVRFGPTDDPIPKVENEVVKLF
jgi:phospholipid-hydroperoxide glutathione peroxidase